MHALKVRAYFLDTGSSHCKELYFTSSMFGDYNSLFQVIYSSASMLSEYIVVRDVDGLLNFRRRNRNHALSKPPHTFLLRLKRKAEPLKIPPKVFLIPPRRRCKRARQEVRSSFLPEKKANWEGKGIKAPETRTSPRAVYFSNE